MVPQPRSNYVGNSNCMGLGWSSCTGLGWCSSLALASPRRRQHRLGSATVDSQATWVGFAWVRKNSLKNSVFPSGHLESLHFSAISIEISPIVLMTESLRIELSVSRPRSQQQPDSRRPYVMASTRSVTPPRQRTQGGGIPSALLHEFTADTCQSTRTCMRPTIASARSKYGV